MLVLMIVFDLSFALCLAAASRALLSRSTSSRDHAATALYSANVLRPAGSPLISLRRARHRPDLAGVAGAQLFRATTSIFRTLSVFNHRVPTMLAAQALGVSGVAKSRRRPKAGGHSRSHLRQVRRGVQDLKRNAILNFEFFHSLNRQK